MLCYKPIITIATQKISVPVDVRLVLDDEGVGAIPSVPFSTWRGSSGSIEGRDIGGVAKGSAGGGAAAAGANVGMTGP